MRLIDADALIADVRKNSESYFADDFAHEWVDRQPTIDAVPVVRCRECIHRFVDGDNVRYNVCMLNHNKVQPDDWFCADGERKDGDAV